MFGPYPNYRRTDLKWFEYLPESWGILRTKQLFRLIIEKAPNNNQMELLSVYTHIGVRPRRSLEQRGNKASTTDGYWVVKKGDIICNKLLAWMGAIGSSHYEGVTSPAYDVLRPIKSCNTDYYHFLFRTKKYLQQFKIRSRGIMDMRLRLYFDQFGQIPIPVPPRPEQDQIVAYLRAQDAHIARFIKTKRDLIKLLTEQKLRIIDHAVTRGLDASVELKPSGIEWLGEVPRHWEVLPLRRIIRVKSGDMIHASEETEEGFPIYGGNGPRGHTNKVNCHGPMLLIGRVGAKCGCIHRVEGDFWASEHALRVIPLRKFDLEFFEHLLRWVDFNRFAIRTAQPLINSTIVREQICAVPPVTEQVAIRKWIADECKPMDDATTRIEDEIKLIREYRDRLIADVVTGQVDVRGWQPGPDDLVDDTALAALSDEEDVEEEGSDGQEE